MKQETIPPLTQLFNRVTRCMCVGREGIRLEEWDVVNEFWASLTEVIHEREFDALLLPLFEEALVLRILTHRLLYELETVDKPKKRKVDYKQGVKAWLKTQERLRTIMEKILKRYGHTTTGNAISLAEIMGSIIEQSEGILDDALEFEASKKSTQEKKSETRRDSGMASTS